MSKKTYPINQGWLHIKINITIGTTLTQEQCLKLIGLTTETAEVAKFRNGTRSISIIARRCREEPANPSNPSPNQGQS